MYPGIYRSSSGSTDNGYDGLFIPVGRFSTLLSRELGTYQIPLDRLLLKKEGV